MKCNVQACLGRGCGEAPLGYETNIGVEAAQTPVWFPQFLPKELSFSVGHSSSRKPAKLGSVEDPCSRAMLMATHVNLTPRLACFLSPERNTLGSHLSHILQGSRYKMQSLLLGNKRVILESQSSSHRPSTPTLTLQACVEKSLPGPACFPGTAHLSWALR